MGSDFPHAEGLAEPADFAKLLDPLDDDHAAADHARQRGGAVHPMSGAVGMDPRHSSDAELFRKRVRQFLDEHLPADWAGIGAIADRDEADRFVERWRATLAANGLLGVSWPKEYGGAGLSRHEQVVLVEELARAGVPAMGYNDTFGIKMLGGTLLRWGTEAQKRWFLPRILSGEDRWCQGFSEPGSGPTSPRCPPAPCSTATTG